MCFREACITQLSQVGPFGLGVRTDNGASAENINSVAVDGDCINMKNPNPITTAYLSIDNIRFCGSRFIGSFETREYPFLFRRHS